VQRGGVVAALVPPAVQVGLVAVQDRGPRDRPGHGLVGRGGIGEAAGGLAVHAELAGDRAQAQAAGGQRLDGAVLITHPRLQPRFRRRDRGGGGLGW
jgi:hypothetical protein